MHASSPTVFPHYRILRLGLPRWLSLVQDFMPLIYLTIIYFSAFYFLHKVSSRKNSYTLRHIQRNTELLTLQKLYNLSYNCDNISNIGESVKYFFLWNYYKSNIRLFSLFLDAFTHFKLYILKYKAPRVWRALMFLLGCFWLIFFLLCAIFEVLPMLKNPRHVVHTSQCWSSGSCKWLDPGVTLCLNTTPKAPTPWEIHLPAPNLIGTWVFLSQINFIIISN